MHTPSRRRSLQDGRFALFGIRLPRHKITALLDSNFSLTAVEVVPIVSIMPRHNKSEKCHHEHYDKKDRHKEHDRHRSDQHHHQQQGNADGSGGMAGGFMKDMLEGAARGAGSAIARRAVAYALSGSAGAMEGAKSGQFDIYLFAQSWAPRYVATL